MKPLKYVNLSSFEKSLDWIQVFFSKSPGIYPTVILFVLCIISPVTAQSRPGDPGFFEEGEDLLDREIERLHQQPERDDDLLTIDDRASDWMQVTSTEGQFVVLMPGTPTQQDKPEILATEAANLSSIGITLQTDEVWFLVAYADYPNTIDLDAPQVLLTQVASAISVKLDNPSREEQEIMDDDHPIREIRFQSPNEISTFRLYLVDRRLYILGTQQSSLNPISDNITRFLDSFQPTGLR
ncbi:MAG: hypothetical protein WBG66_05485 [Geitlerinemataceae cyanobacterium]